MRSIFKPSHYGEIQERLRRLTPESQRQWGRMTPHQAVCHLSDSFKASLGERKIAEREPDLRRRIMRLMAFTLPVPWPKGVPTSPEVDAEREGTRPRDFDQDVDELRSLLARFVESEGRRLDAHYAWGSMTRGEWGRYAYRHLDHHLRQFGV